MPSWWFTYGPLQGKGLGNSTRPPHQAHAVFTTRELSFFCALTEWEWATARGAAPTGDALS